MLIYYTVNCLQHVTLSYKWLHLVTSGYIELHVTTSGYLFVLLHKIINLLFRGIIIIQLFCYRFIIGNIIL